MFKSATAALATAALLALGVGAAHADDATPAPTSDPIVITFPPVETTPADPAPSDPAPSDPAPAPETPVPDAPSVPAPSGSETPVNPAPQPGPDLPPVYQSPVTPALPPANVPVVSQAPAVPSAEQSAPAVGPAEEAVPSPSPSETAAQVPATAQPTMSAAPKASVADVAAGSPVLQAAVTAATGSPLGVQIATVLALLGAGFAYFRLLGSKGRVAPKGGR